MKKITQSIYISVAIIILIGFLLHTSSQPVILHKYTKTYALFLLFLAVFLTTIFFSIPYYFSSSIYKLKRYRIRFTSRKKVLLTFVLVLLLLLFTEWFVQKYNIIVHDQPYYLTEANIHPFLQYSLKELNNQQNSQLHIDEQGFRGENVEKAKPKNTYRIFILGGSTVFNSTTPYELSFPRLIEKQLQKEYPTYRIEVLNAGRDGYTSEHSLIQYLFDIRDYHPDLIILLQGINDLYYSCNSPGLTNGPYESDYSNNLGVLANIAKTYSASLSPVYVNIHFRTFDLLSHFLRYNFYSDITIPLIAKEQSQFPFGKSAKPEEMAYPSLGAFTRNTNYLVRNITEDNTKLILLNQPYSYTEGSKKTFYMQQNCLTQDKYPSVESLMQGITLFNNQTNVIAKANDIPFIDVASQMPKTSIYFTDDVHFTEKGNDRVAQVLLSFITQNEYIH